jgi:hypothetical protein
MNLQGFTRDLRHHLQHVPADLDHVAVIKDTIRYMCEDFDIKAPAYLGSVNSSSKIVKGETLNLDTYIMYLAASDMSGVVNTCSHASEGCRAACLMNSGRAAFDQGINRARMIRTAIYAASRMHFSVLLFDEIAKAKAKADRNGRAFAVRLNGTSDLSPRAFKVDGLDVLETFPDVSFYDYTKVWGRARQTWPANYSLVYSWTDGREWADAVDLMKRGHAVAVPFADLNSAGRVKVARAATLPTSFGQLDAGGRQIWNFPVFDGDKTDARFLDRVEGAPKAGGYIVGLRAKRSTIEGERTALASGFFVAI